MTKKTTAINMARLPKYFTTDIAGVCVIFELTHKMDHMAYSECMYRAINKIRYDGSDAIVENSVGSNAKAMLLEFREGNCLPKAYQGLELTWYDTDIGDPEITIDDVLTMCVI